MVEKIAIGGSLAENLSAFLAAWEQAEDGQITQTDIVVTFDSWEVLSEILTGERYNLLRYLRAHPEPSVSALARNVGRHLRRVQADVKALEGAGLIDRSTGTVRAAADRLQVDIRL